MKKKMYLYLLIIAVFGVFLTRLVFIWSDKELFTLALENKTVVYVSGGSAPRGRILDTNGKVLVDNLGVKTIYYNKIKGISTSEEIEIAKKLASILSVDEGSILEQKEFWLVNNNNGSNLITEEEYKLLDERKLSSSDLYDLKIERITEDMLNEEDELFKKSAKIYSLMNDGYVYSKKEILKRVSDEEYAKVIESNIPGVTGELSWERIYLYGDTLRNILGSIGSIPSEEVDEYLSNGYELTDIVGISYLEKEYEEYLKGKKAKYLVNSDNTLTLVEEEQRGNDLVLSIDIDIQMKAEEIIKDKILLGKKYPNTDYYKDSYALVSDPLTGQIIAMAGIRHNSDDTWSDISLNTINKSFTIGSAVKGATIAVGYQNNLIEMGK